LITGNDALRKLRSYPSYTSGSEEINRILGGGFKAGRLVMVYGKSNSGKSQLAMQAVLCAAEAGVKSLFVDTEGTFRPERVEEMARTRKWETNTLLRNIVYLRCNSATMQAEVVRRIPVRRETADCRLVVIDTLTKNFTLELPGRENMLDRQGALDIHLSEMARDAFLNGRAYLLTNRVTFDRRNLDVGIGGSTVEQLVHTSVHLAREGGKVRVTSSGDSRGSLVTIGSSGIGS
jgi:DNA repair protein RadA